MALYPQVGGKVWTFGQQVGFGINADENEKIVPLHDRQKDCQTLPRWTVVAVLQNQVDVVVVSFLGQLDWTKGWPDI